MFAIQFLGSLKQEPCRYAKLSKHKETLYLVVERAVLRYSVYPLSIQENHNRFDCLIRRRSANVGIVPGMLHVIPAGMFEVENQQVPWSIKMNVWRELLEEVYNREEQQGTGTASYKCQVLQKEPIKLLRGLIDQGSAQLSVTGICCNLWSLLIEVCTVLFVKDESFSEVTIWS